MNDNPNVTERESQARLQRLLGELIPGLEENFWNNEVPSHFKDIFEDAVKLLNND